MSRYQLAYSVGYDACLASIAQEANPYKPFTVEAQGWRDGWLDAEYINNRWLKSVAKRQH